MKKILAFLITGCLLITLNISAHAADTQDDEALEYIEGSFVRVGPVYPFSDLNKLVQCADLLDKMNVPFICEVAPVFYNTDLPAMTNFCSALRDVSKKGGAVVMQKPLVLAQNEDTEENLILKTHAALSAYHSNGVYPMRINFSDVGLFYVAEYDLNGPADEFANKIAGLLRQGTQIDSFYYKAPQIDGLEPKQSDTTVLGQEHSVQIKGYHENDIAAISDNLYIIAACVSVFLLVIIVGHKVNKAKLDRK